MVEIGVDGAGEAGRRGAPVTLEQILSACAELEREGASVTRRTVRRRLGRGSMTTIHNAVRQYESGRVPSPPGIDLTPADRSLISDLGVRALAVAQERVDAILAEREAVMRTSVAAADARADDAIAAADEAVADAEERAAAAELAAAVAITERDAAKAATAEAAAASLRLAGQVDLLIKDRAAEEGRVGALAENLAIARSQLSTETSRRETAEAEARALEIALVGLRAEFAARSTADADSIGALQQSLSAERARLAEALSERDTARTVAQARELELAERARDLAALTAAAKQAQATASVQAEAISRLMSSLEAETQRARELATTLTEQDHAASALVADAAQAMSDDRTAMTDAVRSVEALGRLLAEMMKSGGQGAKAEPSIPSPGPEAGSAR